MPGKTETSVGRRQWIGITEIAGLANLSKATASHALDGTGRLDAETRARVVESPRRMATRPGTASSDREDGADIMMV